MIVIVDYGMGNLRSILNKIERIGFKAIISSNVEDIENAEKLILPGVGSFAAGMHNLKEYNLINCLNEKGCSQALWTAAPGGHRAQISVLRRCQ